MHANRTALRASTVFRLILLTSAVAGLAAFRPFTPINSVCPQCPEKGDRLVFPDGKVVVAEVVGKNQDGYILQKFGELRFVQFPEISKVEWASGAEPRGLDGYDQILLKNKEQTVLHGQLLAIEAGKPMMLKGVRGQVYTVMPKEVLVYYQRGARKAPPKDVAPVP